MDEQHRVVIVGGGFAGLNAAQALSGKGLAVTLIDRRTFHLFTPLLYQVATGVLSKEDIAPSLRRILHDRDDIEVLLGEARGIDAESRSVVLTDDERVPYDTLIVATGAVPSYFGHDEWEGWAPGLKTVEDAVEIKRRVILALETAEREQDPETRRPWMTMIVVGGGPTGVELAGALADVTRRSLRGHFRHIRPSDVRVVLLEGLPGILQDFGTGLSERAEEELERRGVEVHTGTFVTAIDAQGVRVRGAAGEWEIRARTVLWGAGVRASGLGRAVGTALGAEVDRQGRVVVGGDMTVPGHPEVIVIGDVAHTTGPGGDALPGLAPVAIQQGKHAAAVVRARIAGEPLPTFTFRDRGTMATIGRGAAVARVGRLGFDGALAWLAWLAIHLVYLVGFEHRAIVLVRWLWTFFTQRRPSLILTGQMLPPDVPEPRLRAAVGRWVEEETGGAQPVTSRAGALPPQLETIETDGR